jgi:hypothetical protein
MRVQSMIIQVVKNGWIVKPYYGSPFACQTTVEDNIYVFRDIRDLQAQLPKLLEVPEESATRVVDLSAEPPPDQVADGPL